MTRVHGRRTFLARTSLLMAAAHMGPWLTLASADDDVMAETATGRIRGLVTGEIKVFKGIPYGGSTAGANRFMPPVRPAPWTGIRDVRAFGPSAPQNAASGPSAQGSPGQSEDCLVLNVFTPEVGGTGKRPVLIWLHGGGFSTGSGSAPIYDGVNLARTGDVVVVSINHRLNVFGFTHLGESGDVALSGCAGMLDIVAALQWVRDNIERFGGDPQLVTVFGQSGGGRKVATLMAMPGARGLFQRAVIQSGALLRLTTPDDGARATSALLAELGLQAGQLRALQAVPADRLLAAYTAAATKITLREPGMTASSPVIGSAALPAHPWDPAAPALTADIPLLIGYTRTEETFYDRPTPEARALDEAGLRQRVSARIGDDAAGVIQAFRGAHPNATPWDLWILIATEHPRGTYSRELARRKAAQGRGRVFSYRFDWETPEGGGHMRSPHTVEIPFVFNNIATAGALISKRADAHALAARVSGAWVAFARTGDPNLRTLPSWPAYSTPARHTMLFDTECRVEEDPDRSARLKMEQVLGLT